MTHSEVRTYEDALAYCYSFTDYEKKTSYLYAPERFDLSRVQDLLDRLGNPHHRFQSVHIAGTKGKGSTAAMMAAVLTAAGFRTGLYTSPHLHTFCERIRVGSRMIAREEVTQLVRELVPAVEAVPELTTFEIMTALGFLHFARQGIEFAVVEVGLGGRLDATNVIEPRVAAITSLSLDHTQILGDTLAAIAGEKVIQHWWWTGRITLSRRKSCARRWPTTFQDVMSLSSLAFQQTKILWVCYTSYCLSPGMSSSCSRVTHALPLRSLCCL